jgi:hypothetical protein
MIREDRKNELRKLAHHAGLRHETYYLINKQFEREIGRHPPKDVAKKHFNDKPEDYPNVLTATHTKNQVSKDFSTCTLLFLNVFY